MADRKKGEGVYVTRWAAAKTAPKKAPSADSRARSGEVTSIKVHPLVWRAAMRAAQGDASRITIISETEVRVD